MRVLFLEDKSCYAGLIEESFFSEPSFVIEFNGLKFYKKPPDFFEKYDIVIANKYLWPLNNHLIRKVRLVNVRTMFLSDGIIDWENNINNPFVVRENVMLFKPFVYDFLCSPGWFESQFYVKNHFNYLPPRIMFDGKFCKSLNGGYVKSILITTANNPYFTESERDRLLVVINGLLSFSDQFNFILRIFDQAILDGIVKKNIKNETEIDFSSLLANVSCVITTPSSVALTSMMARKPTCQIIYRDSPLFLQTGWMIHESCDYLSVLQGLESADEERLRFQDYFVSNYLPNNDIRSIIRQPSLSDSDIRRYDYNSFVRVMDSPFNFNLEFFLRRIVKWVKRMKKWIV